MRKTKILATLGPSSFNEEVLAKLIERVDGLRINFSHADREEVKRVVAKIREIEKEKGKSVALLGDTKGAELRTANEEEVVVKRGERLRLEEDVGISTEGALSNAEVGDIVLIDDGSIKAKVVGKEGIEVEFLNDGVIERKRKVSLPGKRLNIAFLDDKDREDIAFMAEEDFDFVALSFVNSAEDVREAKELIDTDRMKVVAKIESLYGVNNAEEIIEESYGIMVARGDLGVEVAFEKLPAIQEMLVEKARKAGRISIVATHMLKSMVNSLYPTRAEIKDVYSAVKEGADALMLSEETAKGYYPIEAVEVMAKIIEEAEQTKTRGENDVRDEKDAIAKAAIELAERLKLPLVAPTMHGTTPRKLSKFRPTQPIFVVSPREKVARHLSLVYGCTTLRMDYEPLMEKAEEIKRGLGIEKGVFVFGHPQGNKNTNVIWLT